MMLDRFKSSLIIHGAWLTIAMTPCSIVAGFVVGTFCAVGGMHDPQPSPTGRTPGRKGDRAFNINPI